MFESKFKLRKLILRLFIHYRYRHFLVLLVSSQTAEDHLEWCGLVESKIRYLVGSLDKNQHISLAHVNPNCFERVKPAVINGNITDANDKLITAPFCSMWFIGMDFKKTENLNVDLTECIQGFTNLVHKHATNIILQKEGMEIEVRHVRRKQLATYLDKEILNRERKSMDASSPAVTNTKKRVSTETSQSQQQQQQETPKRTRTSESVSVDRVDRVDLILLYKFLIR